MPDVQENGLEIATVTEAPTPPEKHGCGHEKAPGNFTINVLGVECEFGSEAPMCAACAEPYLNKVSTLCASCKRPIFPGDPVATAWEGAEHPYTHLTFQCSDTMALMCGKWGEGHSISLHELKPDKYPAGTENPLHHVCNTARPVVENR